MKITNKKQFEIVQNLGIKVDTYVFSNDPENERNNNLRLKLLTISSIFHIRRNCPNLNQNQEKQI